jgi:uncharacterized CHY-type Zn-finger protein
VRMTQKNSPVVLGIEVDGQTRCRHYRSSLDVVAIKMKCCDQYYACKDCHQELAGHAAVVWPVQEWDRKAILCGSCKAELTIHEYLGCESRCPCCQALFNPGCKNHHRYYFE